MHAYIAKQPILNSARQVVAYELLYRDSLENTFPMINAEIATERLVEEHLLNSNINKLVDNKPYFINFTEKCILAGLPQKLINKPVVIEVLEDVPPTKAIFNALTRLKNMGFIIALDDFIYSEDWLPFFGIIDIIKFDITLTSFKEIKALKPLLEQHQVSILVEKIETEGQFKQAKNLQSKYFQGYLFSEPEIVLNEINNSDTQATQMTSAT
ncbi:EAL and HDOD domain-containing protein [Moritella sp. Urea-trap-13]|uniref:EAL and HDOD domain-containing protein n=1 Tax=Moritella sp. Urea-trap-13 TaxID=2058327 RepID=UPI000C348AFB|nr:EAL domain-containing protein [Moritella sp. Urea-trap-13]PKH06868.1 signal transduction protein [Moritella sp. Urea-trap-13]